MTPIGVRPHPMGSEAGEQIKTARQKKLCKSRQAIVKRKGANRGLVRAGQRLA